MSEWQPIETAPSDRYILLLDRSRPAWDGNMEVGKWFGDASDGCWWSSGGQMAGSNLSSTLPTGCRYRRATRRTDQPPT